MCCPCLSSTLRPTWVLVCCNRVKSVSHLVHSTQIFFIVSQLFERLCDKSDSLWMIKKMLKEREETKRARKKRDNLCDWNGIKKDTKKKNMRRKKKYIEMFHSQKPKINAWNDKIIEPFSTINVGEAKSARGAMMVLWCVRYDFMMCERVCVSLCACLFLILCDSLRIRNVFLTYVCHSQQKRTYET